MAPSQELLPRPNSLPTLDVLNATVPSDVLVESVSSTWLLGLSTVLSAQDYSKLDDLLIPSATWKDILALTWDFRSVYTLSSIRTMLSARVDLHKLSIRALTDEEHAEAHGTYKPVLARPFPDVAWIQFGFAVETGIGHGIGVARLVPTANAAWKAWSVFTSIDNLKGFPEQVRGDIRLSVLIFGADVDWAERRAREMEFVDGQPTVVIIGGGHNGLEVAARLKFLGVSALVLEKTPRVGDSWRNRYDSLCLHDPVWFDHMAYLPFPSTWPKYPSAKQIGNWLESYSINLDLNVWTSASTRSITWNAVKKNWTIEVHRSDGTKRTLLPKYVVFAHGTGGGVPSTPNIPGKDKFKGKVYHSTEFKSAQGCKGKKALVVGACNSAHDIAHDFYRHGVDITMFQRSATYVISSQALGQLLTMAQYVENGPPADVADRSGASLSHFNLRVLQARVTPYLASTIDKDLNEGLKKAGFALTMGVEGAGLFGLLAERRGGYYINVGTSELIADGHIKIKQGSEIAHYTPDGLAFKDGSELKADVIVFATGYGDARDLAHELCEPTVANKIGKMLGVDEEGELLGVWRDSGHPQMFFVIGNFATGRQYSTYLALQIKAMEERIMGERYTIDRQFRSIL
ncbi:hypothetical protein EW146_g6504 [Bondarzewia mesenterica]|uniref:FAD/NAD(P)-binding domain-containing protein n=1 Tax=Bondarzewia mesenterica TaxID=1095465 RepID=A0A4S4LND5_9AGAM|nr:hypothetical protein EW146_g6504 [Bondarzewia mesenterica]